MVLQGLLCVELWILVWTGGPWWAVEDELWRAGGWSGEKGCAGVRAHGCVQGCPVELCVLVWLLRADGALEGCLCRGWIRVGVQCGGPLASTCVATLQQVLSIYSCLPPLQFPTNYNEFDGFPLPPAGARSASPALEAPAPPLCNLTGFWTLSATSELRFQAKMRKYACFK